MKPTKDPKFITAYSYQEQSYVALVSLVQLYNDQAHIAVYGKCWTLVNNGYITGRIFKDALEELKKLPASPSEYPPYQEFIKTPLKVVPKL